MTFTYKNFLKNSNPKSLEISFGNPCDCKRNLNTTRASRWYYEKNNTMIQIIDCGESCTYTESQKPCWPLVEVIYKK